ncbi:BTB/POZ and MATH domain-containing protein 1-like [Triticum aestivum]|uniref:BTB/POZ and MATH domain-containing protein 1-like n=1 Tax=Triticum aestivum TaxID=4565 RepID=UPI001D008F14|nr:BTB/POZ and MATH domain-containing protein 1-like [Triticum aestivum]
MSYAGVSVIADGKLVGGSTSPNVDAGAASGYHLLAVEGYSETQKPIWSRSFTIGGQCWGIYYNPGGNHLDIADFISLELCLMDITSCPVKAQFEFSFAQDTDNQDPARINVSRVSEFRAYFESHKKLIKREALEKHIKHNSFTIRCDIMVVDDDTAAATPPIIVVPPSDMRQNFTDFLLTREGTDVVFEVGSEMVAAHRCVLAARSTVFKALLFDPTKERTSLTTTATIVQQVDDMDVSVFKAMLGFIYGESLPVSADHENEGVMLHHLLVAADRYDVPRLRLLCEKKLCENICVSTAMTILALAEQHGCNGLNKACYDFLRFRVNLRAAVATDGFDHLCRSCPPVMKEVILAMLQIS